MRDQTDIGRGDNVLFCSFHTPDDYYAGAADRLRQSLDRLGIRHHIARVEKAEGEEWLEICRRKIPFLHGVCQDNPDSRVFWIDVDCDIDYLPKFVSGFSADIIGFQRGFGHPMRIGYANSARFWEPCFWGINTTPAARAYIRDAHLACESITLRATDDYFFEESWRKNADRLSFQMIPATMVVGRGADAATRPFFCFGASGNVAAFKGKAAQHSRQGRRTVPARRAPKGRGMRALALETARQVQGALPQGLAAPLRRLSDKIGFTEYLSPSVAQPPGLSPGSIYRIIHDAREGDAAQVRERIAAASARRLLGVADQAVIGAAQAFLDYGAGQGAPLRLHWWDKPYPGNYGDWLSPLILGTATGRPVIHQRHDEPGAGPHLMAVGSVGRFAQASTILVGTGISRADTALPPDAHYVSLRGPHSAAAVAAAGGPRIERFGDPAVILPRLFPVQRPASTNGRLALVRHFAHRAIPLRLPEQVDELSILRSGKAEILDLIHSLAGYDAVLTSAMHVHITCQAYGIPVGLITFEGYEDAVHGDRIKYLDYAAGALVPEHLPVPVGLDLRHRRLEDLVEHDRVPPTVIDDVAAALAEAAAAYDRAVAWAPGPVEQGRGRVAAAS